MIRVITAPAAYPVTLAEAKLWARCYATDTSEDALLTMLIAAMTAHAEHLTGRAFVERTLEYSGEYFERVIDLPMPPLLELVSVKYTDADGAEQTVAVADYATDTAREPGRVQPIETAYWPSIGYGFNPVRIRYRAGYRPTGSPTDLTDNTYLPAQLRLWAQARIATLYDQRAQLVIGQTVQAIPRDYVDGILDPLVVGSRIF